MLTVPDFTVSATAVTIVPAPQIMPLDPDDRDWVVQALAAHEFEVATQMVPEMYFQAQMHDWIEARTEGDTLTLHLFERCHCRGPHAQFDHLIHHCATHVRGKRVPPGLSAAD